MCGNPEKPAHGWQPCVGHPLFYCTRTPRIRVRVSEVPRYRAGLCAATLGRVILTLRAPPDEGGAGDGVRHYTVSYFGYHAIAADMAATPAAAAAASPPPIVYGTAWKAERTGDLVGQALRAGYRGIDTACQPKHYNEPGVGAAVAGAIESGLVTRSQLWLQTKFTSLGGQDPAHVPYDHTAPIEEQVAQSLAASLQNLGTDYIDSLVLHSPLATHERPSVPLGRPGWRRKGLYGIFLYKIQPNQFYTVLLYNRGTEPQAILDGHPVRPGGLSGGL
jgi:hypothetical protein